jgi:hypothetical protein
VILQPIPTDHGPEESGEGNPLGSSSRFQTLPRSTNGTGPTLAGGQLRLKDHPPLPSRGFHGRPIIGSPLASEDQGTSRTMGGLIAPAIERPAP